MQICEIEYARASAVDNMALDATMLQVSGAVGRALWRLYGWSEPAVTFGYSQQWSWVRTELSDFDGACIRRITGGGIVDHRNDLTYALSIPVNHEMYRAPAVDLYRNLHRTIAEVLLDVGIPADLAPCKDCNAIEPDTSPGICFQQPEPFDVVAKVSGEKLAGAAMKRNRSGILVQGSLSMKDLPGLSVKGFNREFGRALARCLDLERGTNSGTLPSNQLSENRLKFASSDWNQKR